MNRNAFKIIAGTIEVVLSLLWSIHNVQTYYSYLIHPDVLRYIIIPNWILILNFLIGLVGVWSGIKIIMHKWTIKKGYLMFLVLWMIGELLIIAAIWH